MSDEPAFLKLVRETSEPLPRLIYADWLDDIGDPLSTQKSAFLRTWCRLRDVPLTDLEGYADLAEQLEQLRAGLSEEWFRQVFGYRFHITNPDLACSRADAFLRRFVAEGDYAVHRASERDGGWLVSFTILGVEEAKPEGREKEHKRGGLRAKRPSGAAGRRSQHQLVQLSATPLFVVWTTGRVDWHRGPSHPPSRGLVPRRA